MRIARRAPWVAVALALLAIVLLPALAIARPMSGGSFGSRSGFRSSGGGFSSGGYSSGGYGRSYGGGSSFVFLPSWGGYGGFGYGGGIACRITVFHASARTMTESRLIAIATTTHSHTTAVNACPSAWKLGPRQTKSAAAMPKKTRTSAMRPKSDLGG